MNMKISSGRCEISLKLNQICENPSNAEGFDYWVSTQKEKWHKKDCSEVQVKSRWQSLSKREHDKLRKEVLKGSRWLRDHAEERSWLLHPLGLPPGPSQAKHVPNIRISTFVDEHKGLYDVFVDNWHKGARRKRTTSERKGWTAFVHKVPDTLKEVGCL